MVKVVFENNNINDIFNGTAELEISGNHNKATYADGITAGKLVFIGSNLVRDGDTSYMSGGKITELQITDENNAFAFKLTGANISAQNLPHNFTEGNLTGLLSFMMAGNDRVIGSSINDYMYGYGGNDRLRGKVGDDNIAGGAGNDTMTGGKGSDTFYFNPVTDGKSHDVITDFDVFGPVIDHLWVENASYTVAEAHNGRDTLVTLSEGSTILLKHVQLDDLLAYFPHS